jgi:hypothetical protein
MRLTSLNSVRSLLVGYCFQPVVAAPPPARKVRAMSFGMQKGPPEGLLKG